MMRPWMPSMIFMMDWPTAFSRVEVDGTSALVESGRRERRCSQELPCDGESAGSQRCKVKPESPVQTLSMRGVNHNSQILESSESYGRRLL